MDNSKATPVVASKEKASCDVKAIIFDLGNVLIDFDHMIAAQKYPNLQIKLLMRYLIFSLTPSLPHFSKRLRFLPRNFFPK